MQKIRRNSDVNCINLKGRQLKEADTFSYQGSVVTIAMGKFRMKLMKGWKNHRSFIIL
jgi:hypothetical protein